jgi:hypothetical protein
MNFSVSNGQKADTTVYLITCGPGTDTYSIYGHSAIRVEINKADTVYNWGVFDFSAPNFAWKFAKGRLDYMLIDERFEGFLQEYFYEKRWVVSQKVNLGSSGKAKLLSLINENLKPENVKYRYDFFYDDCSTRIRDLFEKSIGNELIYPPESKQNLPTFREKVSEYQKFYPWLQFGIDMIMGSPGDLKAGFRDQMFLPIDLKDNLSKAGLSQSGKQMPLLQDPQVILDFPTPSPAQNFFLTPLFVFSVLLILVIILSALLKTKTFNDLIDIMLYLAFSILSVMMIFFNFFTDHQQMNWNYNLVWLNPFLILCLFSVLFGKRGKIWFRLVFIISLVFLPGFFLLPQSFNVAILPLVLIILFRSSTRAGFTWNPLSV